ncbi:hypothetical protein [Falsirhodobacter sp. 1013]|uniref:hypothetical protein n=1 Tax=Falsirhodobacter sp. 1013 TaxID=3417566 RepID=UPI003EBF2066
MKTLALSTAILALVSGASFAQTAPDSSNPTTGSGAQQAPMTGNEASPAADPVNTGNTGGEPAMNSTQTPSVPGESAPPNAQNAPSNTATPPATTTEPPAGSNAAPNDPAAGDSLPGAAMTPPEGFTPVKTEEVTADMLGDITVYDSEESSVGKIASVMPETGTPTQVIVDVGGFLGIGAKPVSLNISELMVYKKNDGDEVRAYTTMTEDQIKDLPEHEG